jgi:hypothetical protein
MSYLPPDVRAQGEATQDAGCPSEQIRARQVRLFAKMAAALGLKQNDPALYPPQDFLDTIEACWSHDIENKYENTVQASSRDWIKNRIGPRAQEAGVTPVLEAMVEEYTLCLYWDELAKKLHEELPYQERGTTHKRGNISEAVRAQVAPFYHDLLIERGYGEEDAVRLISHAIGGFGDAANRAGYEEACVFPKAVRGDTPQTRISHIKAYARECAQRVLG